MFLVFQRELLEQLTSFKFAAGLLLVVVLFGVNGAVFSLRYQNDVTEYRQFERRWEDQLAQHKTLDNLPEQNFDALKAPLKTAFLASGGQDRLPNDYQFIIRIWGPPDGAHRVFSQNAFIETFGALDWSFLVGTAFSLLALVFVYDSISGEKSRGTLKLVQTYNVSRNALLFGKLLANLAALLAMLLVGMLVSLLLLMLIGQVGLGAAALARLGLFVVLSAVYLTLFVCLGLFLSAVTHRPATTMVLAAFLWVISIVVLPGVGTLIIQQVRRIPTQNEIEQKSSKVWDVINEEFHGNSSNWRGREGGKADNYAWERISIVAQNKRRHMQEEIWLDFLRRKFDQARLVRTIASISPTGLFEYGAESVNGTSVLRDEALVAEAYAYRDVLEQWFRQRDLADSESVHLFYQPGYLSQKPLEVASIPRFEFREPTVGAGLRDALWRIVTLAGETLVMLFAAVVALQRYDVR
ncbi:MAG: ABC transporter permease [Acidobacteriia bacterium]|nr:ABC transporter permease [Terriglobia bacterium]